jgi:hypothetical protein
MPPPFPVVALPVYYLLFNLSRAPPLDLQPNQKSKKEKIYITRHYEMQLRVIYMLPLGLTKKGVYVYQKNILLDITYVHTRTMCSGPSIYSLRFLPTLVDGKIHFFLSICFIQISK